MRGWIDDLGYATAGGSSRSPGFALTALTILVLGNRRERHGFFRGQRAPAAGPAVRAKPEGLVVVLQDDDGGDPSSTSYPAYRDMTEYDVFESVSSFYTDQGFLGELGEPLTPILMEYATASYMECDRSLPCARRLVRRLARRSEPETPSPC